MQFKLPRVGRVHLARPERVPAGVRQNPLLSPGVRPQQGGVR